MAVAICLGIPEEEKPQRKSECHEEDRGDRCEGDGYLVSGHGVVDDDSNCWR